MRPKYDFHGDPERFQELANLISSKFGKDIQYIADVAGGQGMLSKLLNKKYNYISEVIDPRGWRIKGVPGREQIFNPDMASYYDLVIGLHPDEATRAVAISALFTKTILIPCCNFWDFQQRLGTVALVEAIEAFYKDNNVIYERIDLNIAGPKKIALITEPPKNKRPLSSLYLPPLAENIEGVSKNKKGWIKEAKQKKLANSKTLP